MHSGRKFLLVDKPGTIDREEGIWYDSDNNFGVFMVDIPSQFGWTHNSKPCTKILIEQWLDNMSYDYIPITRTFYLPKKRLSMLNPETYYCISPDSLAKHKSIDILCFHWKT